MNVTGAVYFGVHSKEPDPASVLKECVDELSAGGLYWNGYVEIRRLKVTSVKVKKGVAQVDFECLAKLRSNEMPVESAVKLAVWEACNYRFGDEEQDGLALLPLRYPEKTT